jgi:hypothetical protein
MKCDPNASIVTEKASPMASKIAGALYGLVQIGLSYTHQWMV